MLRGGAGSVSRAEAASQKGRRRSMWRSSRLAAPAACVLALACAWAAARGVGQWCTLPPLPPGKHVATPRSARGPPLGAPAAAALRAFADVAARAPFHHVSLCSRPHPKFALLQETAAWHGDTVVPLGMGDKRFQRWGWGFGVKLVHVQEFVRTLPPDDLVMFTDAFDVLLMDSHEGVRAAYLAAVEVAMAREPVDPAAAPGAPPRVPTIIFSTEFYCWPDAARAPEYPAADRAFEFAFLNSGTYIGPAGDLARAMASTNYTVAEDDQRFWTTVYLKSRADAALPRVSLDHESDVFLCMSGKSVWRDVLFDPAARRYKYARTPGQPVVIHFNNAKWDIAPFFDALRGAHCPYTADTVCGALALGVPGAALALAGLFVGRWLLAAAAAAVVAAGGGRLLAPGRVLGVLLVGSGGGGGSDGAVSGAPADGASDAPAAASPQSRGGGVGGWLSVPRDASPPGTPRGQTRDGRKLVTD